MSSETAQSALTAMDPDAPPPAPISARVAARPGWLLAPLRGARRRPPPRAPKRRGGPERIEHGLRFVKDRGDVVAILLRLLKHFGDRAIVIVAEAHVELLPRNAAQRLNHVRTRAIETAREHHRDCRISEVALPIRRAVVRRDFASVAGNLDLVELAAVGRLNGCVSRILYGHAAVAERTDCFIHLGDRRHFPGFGGHPSPHLHAAVIPNHLATHLTLARDRI